MIHVNFSLFCSTIYSNTDQLHSCFIFGLSVLDLKLRVKVTLHKTDVREHTSLDGCNCALCLLIIQMQCILCSFFIKNSYWTFNLKQQR